MKSEKKYRVSMLVFLLTTGFMVNSARADFGATLLALLQAKAAAEVAENAWRIGEEAFEHGLCGGPNSIWRGNLCDEVK